MLVDLLKDYGFTEKEAKTYLANLEIGEAPASTIARHMGENRITIYSVLKELCKKGISKEIIRDKVKYYNVISPEHLLKKQEIKLTKFKEKLPEFSALTDNYGSKPKVNFYSGLEQLKELMSQILIEGDSLAGKPFLVFVGTKETDPRFQKRIDDEFVEYRMSFKTPTKAILAKHESSYIDYHVQKHDYVFVDDQVFNLGNEIVIYSNKIAILIYTPKEMAGIVIESKTLHNGLENIFNLIRNIYKNKYKIKGNGKAP